MPFRTVVGHEAAIRSLQRALQQDRLPTGYLFTGPPHVGKTTLALALAQAANCEQPTTDAEGLPDACGECATCRRIAAESYPDSAVIRPRIKAEVKDEETGRKVGEFYADSEDALIDMDLIRDLRMRAAGTALEARHRVHLVTNAERMHDESANLFLKTLEEPNDRTTFVLTSSRPSLLPATIISRCQTFALHPLHPARMREELEQRFPDTDPKGRDQVVAMSEGAYGRALSLLETQALLNLREEVLTLLAGLPDRELWEALRLGEALVNLGERWWHAEHPDEAGQDFYKHAHDRAVRAALNEVLAVMQAWFRDLLALGQPELLTNADYLEALRRAADRYPAGAALAAGKALEDLRQDLRQNLNLLLATQALFVRLLGLRG